MENKKSFLIYCDIINTIEKLPDEIAGKLFKHLLLYVNDKEPTTDDILVEIAFEPIKQQLKRDLEKWRKIAERNAQNGKKGGRPKKIENPKNPKNPNGLSKNPTEPKKAVNVNVNDNVNDNVILLKKEKKKGRIIGMMFLSI